MSRAQRLLDLIQILRRHRFPVSGAVLAEELGVSLRTVYRDIDTLKSQGAHIDGEPGVGYVLQPGFMLPPLASGFYQRSSRSASNGNLLPANAHFDQPVSRIY